MKNNEGLKFLHLAIENFKSISAKQVQINGQSFLVLGKNAVGKSSLIQALMSPLDSKVLPSQAIKKGEERGKIEITLGGTIGGKPKKYTVEMFFSPGKQNGRVIVSNELGEQIKSPSTFLKSLIGHVSFDITKFLHASKAERVELLKKLTGAGVQIDLISVEITNKKAERKVKKERAESLEGSIQNHGYTNAEIELFSHPVSIKLLQDQMAGMSKAVENYATMQQKQKEFTEAIPKAEKQVSDCSLEMARITTEIKRLQELWKVKESEGMEAAQTIEKSKKNLQTCEAWFASHPKPDVEGINAKITAATEHNAHHEKLMKYGEQQKEVNALKEEVLAVEEEIKKLGLKRDAVIASSQLPIKGLTFSESEVFLDGLLLEEGVINTARLFDVGVEIAMAQNPNLKVIFLNDASLYDQEGLKSIIKRCEEKNYQVIAECVSEDENVEIRFTENDLK